MLDRTNVRDDLYRLGLQRNGTWVDDARAALSRGHIDDLERATTSVEIGPGIPLLLADPGGLEIAAIQDVVDSMTHLCGTVNAICICETADAGRERCFQFESGLALLFLHADSLCAPFAGLAHEFTHALGLTGIAEIDEGLAMFFDESAAGRAIAWSSSCAFDLDWCKALARRQVSDANIYALGASYFASIVVDEGEKSLFAERNKLRKLGSAEAVREHMRKRLIAIRTRDQQRLDGKVTTTVLDELYFRGELERFRSGADEMFRGVEPSALSDVDQLTFGRYVIYLATRETAEIPTEVLNLLQSEGDAALAQAGAMLIRLARAIFVTRLSQSRIALKKNARQLEHLLMEARATSAIEPDVLLQLVQFHKYVPEIAGGNRETALVFAVELSELPGMRAVGRGLYNGIQRGQE